MVLKNDRLKQLGIHTEAIPGAALGRGSKQPSSATLPEPPRRSTEGNPARYRSGFQADPMKTRVRTKLKQPLWSTVIHLRNDHLCRKDCGDRFPNPHILCGQSLRFFVCPNHMLWREGNPEDSVAPGTARIEQATRLGVIVLAS